jgi:hypothetical protein
MPSHEISPKAFFCLQEACQAARFGGGKRPARKAKVSAREQAGSFEFGKKSRVCGDQCKELTPGITEKEQK